MKIKFAMMLLLGALTVCAVPAMAETGTETPAAEEPGTQTEVKEGWDGSSYYVKGKMLKSVLRKIDGSLYYFEKDGKAAVNTLKQINGKKYYFGKKGAAVINTFKKVKEGKQKYAFYFGKNGTAYTAPEDKYAVTIRVFKINKKYYGFDEKAHMVTGLWVINGTKKDTVYSFAKNGVCNMSASKKLTKMAKMGRLSKTMYKDVLKNFGKPKKIRKSDGCNAFAGGTEKDYKDYNFLYPNLEVSISLYTKTGVYRMNGVYTYDE